MAFLKVKWSDFSIFPSHISVPSQVLQWKLCLRGLRWPPGLWAGGQADVSPIPCHCRSINGSGSMEPCIFTDPCLASPWVRTSTVLRWMPRPVSSTTSLPESQLLLFPVKSEAGLWLLFAPFHTKLYRTVALSQTLLTDHLWPCHNLCHISVPAIQLSIFSFAPITFFFFFIFQ